MQELVKIMEVKIGSDMVNGCNARELHAKLQNGYKFSEWVERRFAEAQLIDGQDYIGFSEISEKPQGGRPAIEYHLSLDAAKEIAMLERNDIGKQVRKYFIEFEKKAMAALKAIPSKIKALLADYERQLDDLRQQMRLLTLRTAKPTNEQIFREGKELLRIESEKAKLRQVTAGKGRRKLDANVEKGNARKLAADQLDISHDTLTKGIKVVDTIDELKAFGQEAKAEELRHTLNSKSVNAAYKMMRSLVRQAT